MWKAIAGVLPVARFVWRWTKICLLVAITPAAIITLFLMDSANTVVEYIYRFQTLFAGIAAAVAAYVTVRQMNRTDERAQRRHEQLFGAELRRERLQLEFAQYRLENAVPLFEAYEKNALDFAFYVELYRALREKDAHVLEDATKQAFQTMIVVREELESRFANIRAQILTSKFHEATDFFQPELRAKFEEFELLLAVFPQWRRPKVDFNNYTAKPEMAELVELDDTAIRASSTAVETHTLLLIVAGRELRVGINSLLARYPSRVV